MKKIIERIRSGGQTGADRAALDAARDAGVPIVGWCPKGGWAEDYPNPPGLCLAYPELKETPSLQTEQRTEWNVRDSNATLILYQTGKTDSPGTSLTEKISAELKKPFLVADANNQEKIFSWLKTLGKGITLNIAGPRESESPGIYNNVYSLVEKLLKEFA